MKAANDKAGFLKQTLKLKAQIYMMFLIDNELTSQASPQL